jgi:hypothetical protein
MLRIPEPSFSRQGGVLTYHQPTGPGSRRGGGIRGKVKPYMTPASRLRLMRAFASLDWDALGTFSMPLLFVTLTTGPDYWDKQEEVYKGLERLRDRIEYLCGRDMITLNNDGILCEVENPFGGYVGAFVRKERGKKNGMLHYHLIIVGCRFLSADWLRKAWQECLRSEVPFRVEIQKPEDARKVERYLSKYCSKVGYEGKEEASEEGPETVAPVSGGASDDSSQDVTLSDAHNAGNGKNGNRHWYVWNRKSLPMAEKQDSIAEGQAARLMSYRIRRAFRNILQARIRVLGDRLPREKRLRMLAFVNHLKYQGGFTMLYNPSDLQRLLDWAAEMVIDSG